MIMFGKALHVANLILKTMYNVLNKMKTKFSYRCLLTTIFEFYQVEMSDSSRVEVFEFLDEKRLNQSHVFVAEDNTIYQMLREPHLGPSLTIPSLTLSDFTLTTSR